MGLASFKYFDPTTAPGFNLLTPEQKQQAVFENFKTQNEANLLGSVFNTNRTPTDEELNRLGEFQQKQLRYAQELGKESLKETMKAKMFYDLPKTVADAFAGPQAVMIAGMSRAPGMFNDALMAVPKYNIQPGVAANYNFPQYFK